MTSVYSYSILHPKRVIGLAVLVILAAAPGMVRLKLRTDGHALVPNQAPEILVDQSIRDEFGVEDPLAVLIRSQHDDGLFNVHTLSLVQELTTQFKRIEGIHPWNVISLATEKGDRVRPGTLIFRRFLEPLPTTPVELMRLRDDLRAIKLYTGVLVSKDESATAILIGVPQNMERSDLLAAIERIIAERGATPERIQVVGAPVAESLLGTHILEDLGVPSRLLGRRAVTDSPAATWAIPTTLFELRTWVGQRIGLVPVALLVMALVFFACFGSLAAVFLPLIEVGACLAFVFGLMGWCQVPVYLTIAVLPVMLTAVGVADEIHIFSRYQELLRERPGDDPIQVLSDTMAEMWAPVVKTSITTAVGFLSFALSPIGPVRAFGLFTAVGVLFCMFWSLTVIAAQLALADPKRFLGRRRARGDQEPKRFTPFGRLAAAVLRYRHIILVVALLVTVVAPLGIRRIVVQDSWVDGFAERSEFYQAARFFNQQFLGMHTLLLCADAGQDPSLAGQLRWQAVGHHDIRLPSKTMDDPTALVGCAIYLTRRDSPQSKRSTTTLQRVRRDWDSYVVNVSRDGDAVVLETARRDASPRLALRLGPGDVIDYKIKPEWFMRPEVINRIGALDAFIEQHRSDEVGGVLSTADYISTTEYMIKGRKLGSRRVPPKRDRMKWVWGQYKNVRGEHRWKQAVNADYTRALISIFMKDANFVGTKQLMLDIRAYERKNLRPQGISLQFAGDVAVSQALIDAIVTTQIRSLIGSLIGIFLVTALLGRSLTWGFFCVLPCALAVLVNFAVMGWLAVPLGVATSMFSGMTLGIGVDYAIHLMERYRRCLSCGQNPQEAMTDAVRATGPAIVIDALAVALGFSVLMLSQVPANARLGGLVVLSIAGCLMATLLLLPALVRKL